jgi:O-antigen ligase
MTGSRNILKQRVFYWLLAMVVITLPFPGDSLNTQIIILLVAYWLFYNPIRVKVQLLKENKVLFLLLSSPFWLAVIGLMYSSDLSEAVRGVELKVPFLIFPLVLSSVKLELETRSYVLRQLLWATFVATIFAVMKVGYFKIRGLGDYFYYDKFAEFLDKHTTYFSLIVVVCMLFCLNEFFQSKKKKYYSLVGYIFFIFVLYILSVRISILALLAGTIIIVFRLTLKLKIIAIVAIVLLSGSIYFTPNFQKRFEPSTTESVEINDIEFRKLHWKSVLETISHNGILFGNGTRGNRDFLYSKYQEYGITSAYEDRYNAHNQYLEILMDHGLVGLLVFLLLLFYLIRNSIKCKDPLGISILAVFMIYMLTESILERQSGIVLFSYLMTLSIMVKASDLKEAQL